MSPPGRPKDESSLGEGVAQRLEGSPVSLRDHPKDALTPAEEAAQQPDDYAMNWLARALIGPCLWAVAFSVIYAVHGLGCAWDWPARSAPLGDLHRFVLIALWLAAVAAAVGVFRFTPRRADTGARIARAGSWIGLVSIVLSLAPVLGLSTCEAGWAAVHLR